MFQVSRAVHRSSDCRKKTIMLEEVKELEHEDGEPFFFFWISKNVIYTNGYSMHEKPRANPENTRRKQRKSKKENQSTN